MFESEFSEELGDILGAIIPAYETKLKRAFQNEGIRREIAFRCNIDVPRHPSEELPNFRCRLDDILFTLGSNTIELRRLKLVYPPDFRLNYLSADLMSMILNVGLSLGDLRIEGDYAVNDEVLQTILPVSQSGKILVTLQSVVASGRVGIFIRGDSFAPENYDLTYELKEVSVVVTYYTDDGKNQIVNHLTKKNIGDTIAAKFWPQLRDLVTELFHQQLETVIAEDSVTELLGDGDEKFRSYVLKRTVNANRILDSLLCSAKSDIVAAGRRTLTTPGFSVVFCGRQAGGGGDGGGVTGSGSGKHHRGSLSAERGYVQDLSTLWRSRDMSLYENAREAVVFGYLSLKEFKCGYEKYSSEYLKTVAQGSIKATIYQNRVFVRVSVPRDQQQKQHEQPVQLESLQVCSMKDIDVDVGGLGSLSWLTKDVESWVLGMLRSEGLSVLENEITSAFHRASKIPSMSLFLSSGFGNSLPSQINERRN